MTQGMWARGPQIQALNSVQESIQLFPFISIPQSCFHLPWAITVMCWMYIILFCDIVNVDSYFVLLHF